MIQHCSHSSSSFQVTNPSNTECRHPVASSRPSNSVYPEPSRLSFLPYHPSPPPPKFSLAFLPDSSPYLQSSTFTNQQTENKMTRRQLNTSRSLNIYCSTSTYKSTAGKLNETRTVNRHWLLTIKKIYYETKTKENSYGASVNCSICRNKSTRRFHIDNQQ